MGTNFYLMTKSKELKNRYLKNAVVVDEPDFGYRSHIAKTSCGWLPLFEAYNGRESSVKQLLGILRDYPDDITVIDEYDRHYTLGEFVSRVVEFNGGYKGGIPEEICIQDKNTPFYDNAMPDFIPVSHFDYGKGKYAAYYFKDADGYEFTEGDFC